MDRDRQMDIHVYRWMDRQIDGYMYIDGQRQIDGYIYIDGQRQIDGYTCIQMDGQVDRQVDRYTIDKQMLDKIEVCPKEIDRQYIQDRCIYIHID